MREVLFMLVLIAASASGCATAGYTGFTGVAMPGYEAAQVVAGNQMMVAAIASQAGAGQMFGIPGFGNVPVCRLQDLRGLPPVNQPVLVRVPKSKGHRAMDALFGAGAGAGIVYLNWGDDWRRLAVGAATGASVGGLVTNHEPDQYCLFLPLPRQ